MMTEKYGEAKLKTANAADTLSARLTTDIKNWALLAIQMIACEVLCLMAFSAPRALAVLTDTRRGIVQETSMTLYPIVRYCSTSALTASLIQEK